CRSPGRSAAQLLAAIAEADLATPLRCAAASTTPVRGAGLVSSPALRVATSLCRPASRRRRERRLALLSLDHLSAPGAPKAERDGMGSGPLEFGNAFILRATPCSVQP